jgi:hypothetical protein
MSSSSYSQAESILLPLIWHKINAKQNSFALIDRKNTFTPAMIQEVGMCLQLALAINNVSQINDIAEYLESIACLDDVEDSEPLLSNNDGLCRLAAVYHLWPYYSSKYFGYLQGLDEKTKLFARNRLCQIQKFLFRNKSYVRHTLDFLRDSFGVRSDESLKKYLNGVSRSEIWRHPLLINDKGDYPDLCAIDSLAVDMITMESARTTIDAAKDILDDFIKDDNDPDEDDEEKLKIISNTLLELWVAQITVFYAPSINSPNIMKELIFSVESKNPTKAKFLKMMIPFHVINKSTGKLVEDDDASYFRQLADTIYSSDKERHPGFYEQKEKTITNLESRVKITSSGSTTYQFLKAKRHFQMKHWPIWYKKKLNDLTVGLISSWDNHDYWWEPLDSNNFEPVIKGLFGSVPNLNTNHHAWALKDYIASREGNLIHNWQELMSWVERCTPSEEHGDRIGYLLELMLRREEDFSRTSFFLGGRRSFDRSFNKKDRLYQFVGGTFIGLERPGIPFEQRRYIAIADRIKDLIKGLAEYSSSVGEKARLEKNKDTLKAFISLKTTILSFLSHKKGLPFTREYIKGTNESDHSKADLDKSPTLISLKKCKLSFHKVEEEKIPSNCFETLKAIFALDQGKTKSLEGFKKNEESENAQPFQLSYKKVLCADCLEVVIKWLLGKLSEEVEIKVETRKDNKPCSPTFCLPSRPGIRFLISLAEYVTRVNTSDENENKISQIVFTKYAGQMEIKFQSNIKKETIKKLTGITDSKIGEDKFVAWYANFVNNIVSDKLKKGGEWVNFLQDPIYASVLTRAITENKMIFWWTPENV